MRFTERELTLALAGAAKDVLAVQDKSVRKGKKTVDQAWDELGAFGRFQMLDGLGGQVLPVLVALPDVDVEVGTRPTFTDEQVRECVESHLGELSGVRRKLTLEARVALIRSALAAVPPRQDPDAFIVPDHI